MSESGKDQQWSRGWKESQRVLIPPSRHVATSFQDIVESLARHNYKTDAEQHQAVAEQLDFATLHDFQIVRRRLKESFKPFNDAALHCKSKLKDVDGAQADKDEVDFLEDLYALLRAAHFSVLSAEEWQSACNHDFTFTNPMDVAWASLDQQMLSRFWKRKENEFRKAASISDRVLIMHRGIKLSHACGKFYQEKVDLLVEYLIANPLEQYVQPILQKYKIAWEDWWPTIQVVGSKDTGMHRHHQHNPYKQNRAPSQRDPLLDHQNAKWVTRVTLRDVMPDASRVWSNFFKEVHLQEPTFKEAILLYRRAGSPQHHRQPDNNGSGSKANIKKQLQYDTYGRNIFIKRFHDIPNADLEMIFPDKTVYLKPVLLLQIAFTIVLGLLSVLVTLLTSEASWSVLGGILSIVFTRAYQVYTSATIGRQQVLDDITDRLYEQTMDAQEGVLYFLLDQMADQHVKELLLAYFLLLDKNAPMTQQQLDKACEDFLHFQFGEKVDFALENSLPTLCDDGLIRKDAQGLLHAVPLEESRKLLGKKGASFFGIDDRKFKSNIPTFSRLSSRSLQKYMKNPQSSQPSSSSIPEQRPPRAQPPAPAPAAPSSGSLASGSGVPVQQTGEQSYQGSTTGLLDKPSGFNGGNPATGQQAPATTNVHVQSPPTIEYEDDEPPQAAPQFSAHNASSSTPPSAGHPYEAGTSGTPPVGLIGKVKAALGPEDSRL